MSNRKISTNQELTQELILQTARSLFIEKGFQDVSMRSIAKQLGSSHGALYYHFNNKAELFYAIVEMDFVTLNNLLEEAVEGPGDDSTKLHQLFLNFIEFGLNHQNQYEIMFIVRNTEVNGLSQNAANLCYENFAQSVQLLVKKQLAVVDVWSVFLALNGFVTHFRGYVGSFEEVRGVAESHVKFILKGLND